MHTINVNELLEEGARNQKDRSLKIKNKPLHLYIMFRIFMSLKLGSSLDLIRYS